MFEDEEKAIKLAMDVGLVPHPENSPKPPCRKCGAATKVKRVKGKKLGFLYVCTKNHTEMCTGTGSKAIIACNF